MARNHIISGANEYGSDIYKQGEELLSVQPSIQNAFVISHLNHKSSVLCPKSRNITEQYLALEQLEAHQKMIAKAKGQVDTSAPKSLQSYLSSVENARRNHRKNNNLYNSRISSLSGSETKSGIASPPAEPEGSKPIDQVDATSSSSSSGAALDKCIQTSTVLSTMNSKVADKISWYLEAVCQGEFSAQPAGRGSAHRGHTIRSSSRGSTSSSLVHHRNMKGDVMDWHHDKFKQSKRPFSPRILVNSSAKSKVHDMRCYNSPSKKIARASGGRKQLEKLETSSDITPAAAVDNSNYSEWICDQAWRVQIRQKLKSKLSNSSFVHTTAAEQDSFPESQAPKNFGCRSSLEVLSQDEESKYLKYLSEVTEDILRSGIYTDRAIKRAFEFHLQFQDKEADREKLQQLLEQVLEDLSIDDSEDAFKRSVIPSSLKDTAICNSPPEKETLDQQEHELILSSNSVSSKMTAAELPTDLMENAQPNDLFSSETYLSHDLPCSDSNELERHKSSLSQYPKKMNQFGVS